MGPRARVAVLLSALAGLALAIFLVAWFGAGSVLHALAAIGWRGLLLLAAIHLIPMTLCGTAWRAVMPPNHRVPLHVATGSRILRDAGAELLPISPAGGAVMGARALMLAGMPGAMAFASTVVDITMELIAQLLFTAAGIIVLLQGQWAPSIGAFAVAGLAVGLAAAFGFVLAQRVGLFILLERLSERLARGNPGARKLSPDSVHHAIRALYRRHGGIAVGLVCHLFAWTATAFESWVALHLIGVHLAFNAIFMIESLVLAMRSGAFVVPSGWGVQEGGYVLLGAVVNLSAGTALALSLAKRARELTLGTPALVLWQALETRQVRRALS
jgi:glycosyltransferase 2 family protein